MDRFLSDFEGSGYVSGNDRGLAPQQSAESQANHSICLLPGHHPQHIVHRCIPDSDALTVVGQIAQSCTPVQAPATIPATIGGALTAPTYHTAPAVGYSRIYPEQGDDRAPTNVIVCHGLQPNGLYLIKADLETYSPGHHTPGQDADAARRALEYHRPDIARKLDWHRSEHGGWHGWAYINRPIAGGKLYDQAGRHIGDMIAGEGAISIPPDGLAPGWLSATQLEQLLGFWHVDEPAEGGERWSDRAKEGLRYTAGWQRHRITLAQLRTFLQEHAGPVGRQLDRRLDERPDDRSNAAGHLAQCLMLHIHKIAPAAGFSERCALVMAYWTAADSFGKAGEKGYTQERDGCSLIAQIVNGDPYGPRDNPRRWIIPFWAKAHPTRLPAAPEPTPAPAPDRPAHRPKGDAEKHLQTFRRVLQAIEPDDFGRRVYTLDYLAERMRAARCPVKPRTIQSYLQQLRASGEISTAQIGGNGRPYALLTSRFGGADKYQRPPAATIQTRSDRGANACATQPIETPENTDRSHACKEDHQNPSAPPPAGPGASYSPELGQVRPRRRRRVAQSPKERQARAKRARQAKCRAMDAPDLRVLQVKLERTIAKKQRLGAKQAQIDALQAQLAEVEHYLALKDALHAIADAAGPPPTAPTAPAPGGAQLGFGALLSAPAGAPLESRGLVDRLRHLQAQRQAGAL